METPAVGDPAFLEHQDVGVDAATGVDHVEGPTPPVHAAVHVEAGDDHRRHCPAQATDRSVPAGRPGSTQCDPGPPQQPRGEPAGRRSPRSSDGPIGVWRAQGGTRSGTLREPAQPWARSADINWDDVVPERSPQRPPPGDGHPGPPPPRSAEPAQADARPSAHAHRPAPCRSSHRTPAPQRRSSGPSRGCGGPTRPPRPTATSPRRRSPTPSSTSRWFPAGASRGTRCRTSPSPTTATGTGTTFPPWPAGSCSGWTRRRSLPPTHSTSSGDACSTSNDGGTTSAKSPRAAPPSTCGPWSTPSARSPLPSSPPLDRRPRRPTRHRPRDAREARRQPRRGVATRAVASAHRAPVAGARRAPGAGPRRRGTRPAGLLDRGGGRRAMARHPSRYDAALSVTVGTRDHGLGRPGPPPRHDGAARDLKPMPSAEPLPKPPVISPAGPTGRDPLRPTVPAVRCNAAPSSARPLAAPTGRAGTLGQAPTIDRRADGRTAAPR